MLGALFGADDDETQESVVKDQQGFYYKSKKSNQTNSSFKAKPVNLAGDMELPDMIRQESNLVGF